MSNSRQQQVHLRLLVLDQISSLNTGVEPNALVQLAAEDARITPEDLASFATPTLVIAGEHDLLFPAATLRGVADVIPGADFREFPGCGHSVYFEDPEPFNRTVRAGQCSSCLQVHDPRYQLIVRAFPDLVGRTPVFETDGF